MNRISYPHKVVNWLLLFLELQLLITCVSLPILIAWGLPFSPLSFIGNLVFSPFLSLFLLLSSLVFFCECLSIPNAFLITALEKVTSAWLYCINSVPAQTTLGFAKPSFVPFLFIIPLGGLLIHLLCKTNRSSTLILTLFLLSFFVIGKLHLSSDPIIDTIPCNKKVLHLIGHGNSILLIDTNALSKQSSALSYIEYKLIPALFTRLGTTEIDCLILLNPTKRVFDTVAQAVSLIPIKKVYLAAWEGSVDKTFLKSFWYFKRTLEKRQIDLKRIYNNYSIRVSPSVTLLLENDGSVIKKGTYSIKKYAIFTIIDKKRVTVYDSKND